MRKILTSLVMIAVVSASAVAATSAYFTSEVVLGANTFSTGTVVLTDTRDSWMIPFSITNMKPGDWNRRWVNLTNAGTLDIDYLKVNKTSVVDGSGLLAQINVSVPCRVSTTPNAAYFTDDWGVKPTVASWFNDSNIIDGPAYYETAAGVLHPGETYVCAFDFSMPTTVGNAYQGQSATFDLVFTAEQTH